MNGFSWVIKGEIAGMASPAGKSDEVWPWIAAKGIGLVVSLTAKPPDRNLLAGSGLDLLHMPVPDFTAPSPEDVDTFIEHARFYRHEGRGIVVHCGAGYGRTGTMIACYLVDKGMNPEDAIAAVRAARPGSVETREQEEAVHSLAERLA